VSTSNIRETFEAAFPFREVSQPRAMNLAFPDIYTSDTVALAQPSGGGGGVTALSDILQSTLKEASDSVGNAAKQLSELQAVQQQLLASTNQNTQALNSNTSAKDGGSGVMSTVGNVASSVLGQGSILSPIITGIMHLFGGGSTPEPQPSFSPWVMPAAVNVQTTLTSAQPIPSQPGPVIQQAPGGETAASGPKVQIQVNAIDSRSFLDHSSEIADAVRQALLNSHSLGDVIAEM